MGLFNDLFKSVPSEYKYTPANEQEAWVGLYYAVMAADGAVSDTEIDNLSRAFVFKSMFDGHDLVQYYKNVAYANLKIGNKGLIDACVPKIPQDSKATLFCMLMELVLSDGMLEPKEQEIIQIVAECLKLDSDLAKKIVEVLLIKNKGNKILLD